MSKQNFTVRMANQGGYTMTNALQVIKSTQLNGINFDCYAQEGDTDDFWATREQIGQLLGYENPRYAIAHIHQRNKDRLDKFSSVLNLGTEAGQRTATVYNFKGLLEICRYSNQPKADAVMDFLWNIADEIRRTGFYAAPATAEQIIGNPDAFIEILKAYKVEKERAIALEVERAALQAKAEQDKPKVLFAESVTASDKSILVRDLAKILRQNGYITGEKRLFAELRERGYLIKHGSSYNTPTQKSMELGLMEIIERTVNRGDGEPITTNTTKITGKGQIYFINLFLGNRRQLAIS